MNYEIEKYKPQGWICDECGNFIPDENKYIMNLYQKRREDRIDYVLKTFRNIIKYLKSDLKYQKQYTLTERDLDFELRIQRQRAYYIFSAKVTRHYLKGLKQGYKDSKKFHDEEIERIKLSDDQIIKQAEIIQRERKAGIRN